MIQIATFFSGCGGLDLGFKQAGFNIAWSNEFDKNIADTHLNNFPNTIMDTRSITKVNSLDIPPVDGFIGGPPCQSWSVAGSHKGAADHRGQLFFTYIQLISEKKPKFFLAENVAGILTKKHELAFSEIIKSFDDAGYDVFYKLLNANDYSVPQDRKRVIIVGFRKDLKIKYTFPKPHAYKPTLRDAIYDLRNTATPAKDLNHSNGKLEIPNHEFMIGGFSSMFLSRNRVRAWDEPSFTIQASGRHAPIHPNAPKMVQINPNSFIFEPDCENLYRRLSVRECARIQTFPDSFIYKYKYINDGYKMIGNAVPVLFAKTLAESILSALDQNSWY